MPTATKMERLAEGLAALIDEIETLSLDYGDVVQEALLLAREQPLDDNEALRLYTAILTTLRTSGRKLSKAEEKKLAAEISAEASALVADRPGGSATAGGISADVVPSGGLVFHAKHGLRPRPVVPMQMFNGRAINLIEGYVDVSTIPLWTENHRVQLYVQEFRETEHRDPDNEELLDLMYGVEKFGLQALAQSVARKGVERPPIVTWEGEPKDGNRRIAASRLVLDNDNFSVEEKERARWIRVWQAPEGTTDDQFEAIVVALNFEPDHKLDWPEYVKARLVVERFRTLKEAQKGPWNATRALELRKKVAEQFAIKHSEVKRYLAMVQWADDFEEYHVEERGLDGAAVRYKANDVFQWFYEIQAGRDKDKVIEKITQDEHLRAIVYDLMYDVFDSGVQVRSLHKVIADEQAFALLRQAHDEPNPEEANKIVEAAIAEAMKNSPTKKLGFDQFLRGAVDRLGSTPPDQWRQVDEDLLQDLHRVFSSALGSIDGVLGLKTKTTARAK